MLLLSTRRRAQCDKLLGPATAALHSAVAPAAARSHAAATGSGSKALQLAPISEVAVGSSSGGDGILEAISDEARYWSRLWRAADAMDGGGHFLAGASARFAASAPQVACYASSCFCAANGVCRRLTPARCTPGRSMRRQQPRRPAAQAVGAPATAGQPPSHMLTRMPLTRSKTILQELLSKLPRAGHTATPVGRKLIIAGGILQEGSLTMDVLTIDPARLSISRCMRGHGAVPVHAGRRPWVVTYW